MQRNFLPVLLVATAVALTGCAAPGVQFKQGNKSVKLHEGESAQLDLDRLVDIYPITPTLLREMQLPAVVARNNPPLTRSLQSYEYQVGPGDVLNIVVWDHPALNPAVGMSPISAMGTSQIGNRNMPSSSGNGTVVDAQGNIFFPYAGKIKVAGLSAAHIRNTLTSRLSRYIRAPQVDVTVVGFQSKRVNVSGAVKTPAQLALNNSPITVLDAINLAGGFNENANMSSVKLTRNGVEHTLSLYDAMNHGDMTQNTILGPNDVVFVPTNEQSKVHVMGEVKKQATLHIPQGGMTLTDALGLSEGIDQSVADATGVFVIRNAHSTTNPDKIANVYQLNLKDASAFAMGNRFRLEPNDVVFVTVSPVARWNRVLSQIFSSVAVMGNLAAIYSVTK